MNNYVKNPVFLADTGYAIFFDDIRVDHLVKDYTVNMGINSTIGTASINMVYVPDLDKIIHNEEIISSSKSSPEPVQRTVKVTKAKVVNCYHLAIREGPSMNNKEIAWVNAGDILDYHGKGGNNNYWINVTANGKKGWAGGKYIELVDEVQGSGKTRAGGSSSSIVVGSKVKLNSSASKYATGQKIPSSIKNKTYTVQQVGSGKYLLKEIYSWVKSSDVTLVSGGGSQSSSSSSASSSNANSLDNSIADGTEDGVENMTNVRIFVKNIFNGKYIQVFGGNITSKSITLSGTDKTLSFQAQDFMNWLSRTVCPIAVPFDDTLASGDRLKWKAQGIDLNKVQSVNSVKEISFKGKTLKETWDIISRQTIESNKLYSDPSTVAKWDDAINRVVIMGDIDEKLRRAEVVDFMITSSATQVNSAYVLMNDILKTLMFEFYQDRDEVIRIKPPFWNEHVIKDHVIDPALILSYTESTNYSQMFTRVIATGGLDEWQRDQTSSNGTITKLITPVVAVTSSGIAGNSGPVTVTSQIKGSTNEYIPTEIGTNIASSAVKIATNYVGWPYIWGGDDPSDGGFDCSGLIMYAYKKAGFTGWTTRETTYTMIKKGWAVNSYNDLKPGDAIFPNSGHVYMYIGNNQIVEAPKPGKNICIRALPREKNIGIRRFVDSNGNSGGGTQNYSRPDSVGPDSLLQPTFLEKKYGPLIYDCSQPLIKFSTAPAANSSSAYDALTKYAKFMLNYLNSSVTMSSVQTIAMPWLRPGFNVWVDPVRTDKIFYINQISHYGNQSGNYTTLNLTMGRRRKDFTNNSSILGGLKPGKSDDIFVNSLVVTPTNFGTACNYNEVSNKVKSFYKTSKTYREEYALNSPHFSYFYGSSLTGTPYKASATKSSTTTTKSEIKVGSKVKLKSSASRYFTGEKIPAWVKSRTHTVQQVATNKVLLKEIYSWVNKSDLGGETISTKSSGGTTTGTVYNVKSFLNVRNGPSTSYASIGKLYAGNTVNIIREQSGWYNINYNGNTNAWASKNYIKSNGKATSSSSSNSNYASHSSSAYSPSESSLSEIQTNLTNKYKNANTIVKERSARLKKIINKSEKLMKYIHASKQFDIK